MSTQYINYVCGHPSKRTREDAISLLPPHLRYKARKNITISYVCWHCKNKMRINNAMGKTLYDRSIDNITMEGSRKEILNKWRKNRKD